MTTYTTTTTASLVVADNKAAVPNALCSAIVAIVAKSLSERGAFTIALSGGSLPSFLWPALQEQFDARSIDPRYENWHVLLADERCVPSSHDDSNMKSIREKFLDLCPKIPSSQVHGISEDALKVSTSAVAEHYEGVVKETLAKCSGGQLDLAVLGFGPDGHTCSLFPGHALLQEKSVWVAPIEDSPKPPPQRITLTLPVLNTLTRHVIVCGAGSSKSPILKEVFVKIVDAEGSAGSSTSSKSYQATLWTPGRYPCSMVRPDSKDTENTLTWVVDADAMEGVSISAERILVW